MVKIFKTLKKTVTGQESIKDAFTDFEKFQQEIQPYAFMPFDMMVKCDEAIDTLLAQREDMMTYNLMKERVPDVGLTRCRNALEELKKEFPEEPNMFTKCLAPCVGPFKEYSMQKLVAFDTAEREIQKIIQLNIE